MSTHLGSWKHLGREGLLGDCLNGPCHLVWNVSLDVTYSLVTLNADCNLANTADGYLADIYAESTVGSVFLDPQAFLAGGTNGYSALICNANAQTSRELVCTAPGTLVQNDPVKQTF